MDHTVFYKCSKNGNGGANGNGASRYSVMEYLCDVLNESENRQIYDARQINATTALQEHQCRAFEKEIRGNFYILILVSFNINFNFHRSASVH